MGLGQTILTTAFLVLLTIAVVTANNMMIENTKNYYKWEARKQANYYAYSLLDEISRKKFDETFHTMYYMPQFEFSDVYNSYPWSEWGPSLTAKSIVNPGGKADTYPYKSIRGDNNSYFNDVDDYDGYIREVNTGYLKGFKLKCIVRYNNDPLDYTMTDAQTYTKRAYVFVWNTNYLPDTLTYYGEAIQYTF